jgi:pyrroline-5-carboxylate reductase
MKIAFIGAGVMGETMIKGLLAKGLCAPADIVACDISTSRLETLRSTYKIKVAEDYIMALKGADVVVLAVKPQNLAGLMPSLKDRLHKAQLVLSIIAGATISTITDGLGHGAVVRAMPNTPAQIGAGVCVWTCSGDVNQRQKDMAKSILNALGMEIYVPEERYIDMATAVSGSGPAYIYKVMEALIDAAVRIGLSREMAETLVQETAWGAALLAKKTNRHPEELRKMVTSRGGTTEAGLAKLAGVEDLFAKAVEAAYTRAKELGR